MKSISMNTALLTEKWKFKGHKIKTRTGIIVQAEEENVSERLSLVIYVYG